MNILIFVISLLMMLALLTYGRLDMYRSFIVTQGEFEKYMVENERTTINNGAEQWYQWTSIATKNGNKKTGGPSEASPKLNLNAILNPDIRTAQPQLELVYRDLLKKVIYIVFGEKNEFKKALDKDPNVIDDLIQAMEVAGNRLASEKKMIKTTEGLENLDLQNSSLQDFYYWMLKGYPVKKNFPVKQKPVKEFHEENAENPSSEEENFEEYLPKNNRLSLLDFVTVNPKKSKIRIFLAPRAILLSIFGDIHTVNEVMQTRLELYRQFKSEEENKNLSEQFKQKFLSRVINVPESILDFTVSGTDPRQYEVQ